MDVTYAFVLFHVLCFVSIIDCQEPTCTRFEYDERVLKKLIIVENGLEKLEDGVRRLKEELNAHKSEVEEQIRHAVRNAEGRCHDAILAATTNVVKIPTMDEGSWRMIFRGTAGNGDNIHDAWSKGTAVTTIKPSDMKRSMDKHYLDLNFVNDWETRNIARIKLSLFHKEMEVAYVILNVERSTRDSWFLQKNLVSSTWSSLTPSESLAAFGNAHPRRQLFINKSYGGCENDAGYMVVSDVIGGGRCVWETHLSYPMFLYSKINGPTVWADKSYGMADYMAIFVEQKLN